MTELDEDPGWSKVRRNTNESYRQFDQRDVPQCMFLSLQTVILPRCLFLMSLSLPRMSRSMPWRTLMTLVMLPMQSSFWYLVFPALFMFISILVSMFLIFCTSSPLSLPSSLIRSLSPHLHSPRRIDSRAVSAARLCCPPSSVRSRPWQAARTGHSATLLS